jgi:hypothetical protein
MTHPSKRKGNRFEREIVDLAVASGLESKRAYASNGESLGLHAEVDLVIAGKKIQAKRRAKIAKWLQPNENVDAVVVRQDHGQPLIVMSYFEYLDLIKELENGKRDDSHEGIAADPPDATPQGGS